MKGFEGFVLHTLKTVPGLCIGQTFPWLALRNRHVYRAWALEFFEKERPVGLIPAHGEAVVDPALSQRLSELVRSRLR